MSLGASKSEDLNRRSGIDYDFLYLRGITLVLNELHYLGIKT